MVHFYNSSLLQLFFLKPKDKDFADFVNFFVSMIVIISA